MSGLELLPTGFDSGEYLDRLERAQIYEPSGKVVKSVGMIFEAHLPGAESGAFVEFRVE